MTEREVARDQLQQELVYGVEQVRATARGGISDVHVRFDALDRAHAGADDTMRGLEVAVVVARA
jgi:hypothetical protein